MPAVAPKPADAIGGYLPLQKIGEGAMGTVYKAKNQKTGETVALKVIHESVLADPTLRLRFAQECQISRQLVHRHLVRVLDFGLDGDKAYLVMEYLESRSVADILEEFGPFTEAEAVRVIQEIGKALTWAHRRRLLHRDVKPDNILVTKDRVAKLTDLGLAKYLEADVTLTQTRTALGTPNFMAPEQFEDARKATVRSDVYSLAATLYMMVSGVVPFRARSAKAIAAIYKKQLSNDIVPPSQLAPGLSPHVEDAILKGLRAQPQERFASVQEFLDALQEPEAPVIDESPSPAASSAEPATRAAKGAEQRRKKRFSCRRAIACQVLHRIWEKTWKGQVANISETGLCLRLSRRFEKGTLLTIRIEGENLKRHSVVVRVVWIKRLGPGQWDLGCQYDQPLAAGEVDILRS